MNEEPIREEHRAAPNRAAGGCLTHAPPPPDSPGGSGSGGQQLGHTGEIIALQGFVTRKLMESTLDKVAAE
ncbi:hypothetical protein [Erythrobacter sp.]|uniref:hypothetical protein n=1 Tax=Erythrobacter sp. TaxID=1042 RepID=UPI0025E0E083|nr:hypothetical protein [Erythrobacter sp.]